MESGLVLAATVAAVVGMIHLKDHVNRSEAMRAMGQLGEHVLAYRKEYGSLPGQSFVDSIEDQLEGSVRIGNVRYRALWIGLEASGDTILAYSQKRHPSSLLEDGYVVLRLDGRVEWVPRAAFEALLAGQQTPAEIEAGKK
jgi:hypothetical protein